MRFYGIAIVCAMCLGCSHPDSHVDDERLEHLAGLLPEELLDFRSDFLQLTAECEGIERLVQEAGMPDEVFPAAAAMRVYRSGQRSIRVFIFEMSKADEAKVVYDRLDDLDGCGDRMAMPIPGLGLAGRTRVNVGLYEVETWVANYVIRAIGNDTSRETRRVTFDTCLKILDLEGLIIETVVEGPEVSSG